jgi:hypothetical protein
MQGPDVGDQVFLVKTAEACVTSDALVSFEERMEVLRQVVEKSRQVVNC